MASIMTGIQLQDNFSTVLYDVCGAVNMAISSMMDMQSTMNADINLSSLDGAIEQINSATAALNEMNETIQNTHAPQVPTPQPVQWQSDNFPVFTGNGIERFQQEAQQANVAMQQLSNTQDSIARQAFSMHLLPPEAFQDMNSLAVRIDNLRERIQMISDNPLNIGNEQANNGLEQLRSQLSNAIQQQNALNDAMNRGDISAINNAYLQLSQTVNNTERYIRENTNEQGRFNQQIRDGTGHANNLMNSIKGMVGAYLSIQGIKNVLGISDELIQTNARLEMMNEGFGDAAMNSEQLMDMVYASAQDARGSLQDMANVVGRFGNNARDAFKSPKEVIDFANLVQKQMTIAGATTNEASNAMLQLSQALGSGVLRGDELNSIFDQAPNLIQSIADYMGVSIGQIKELAAEGQISADTVKSAIFASADEINSKFSQIPMTWGQIFTLFQNDAKKAFEPVLQRINEMANSPEFQNFVNSAINALAIVANIVLNIFDLIGQVGTFIADNWSVIKPIIMGIVFALGLYYGAMILYNIITGISAGITAAKALAAKVHAASLSMEAGATFGATAAQYGFNTALLACPLTWIILLLIAIIAVVVIFANKVAETSEIAVNGFSVICGWINVVIQFFKNLGLEVANIALGIWNALGACATNMGIAFHNAIAGIRSWFYGLLSDALNVVAKICAALNQLPFVEFDYSGITAMADDYAAKSAAAAGSKEEYTSISDAFNSAANKFDTFKDGWVTDAYNNGVNFGNGISDKISGFFSGLDSDKEETTYTPSEYDYAANTAGAGGDAAKTAANTGNTAANTAAIAESLDITNEELEYLRDIAERDVVNRFTTASIKVEMNNSNNINSDMDLDGIVNDLTNKVEEAMAQAAEGVHI